MDDGKLLLWWLDGPILRLVVPQVVEISMYVNRRVSRMAFAALLGSAPALTTPAHAFNLKSIVKDIGKIGGAVAKLPNPITTPIQIITGKQNPLNVKDFVQQQSAALGTIIDSTRNITNVPWDATGQVVSEVGGDKARIVFEFATGPERIQREFVFTAAQAGAATLQGQDPLLAVAMPLAAAIRDARSKYAPQAKSFPAEVITLLGQVIPRDILERARYTVGDVKIALPSAIIGTNAFLGAVTGNREKFSTQIAVALDDIIVFPRQLNFEDIDDLKWVAHEVFHVRQYRDWGIDQFAFNYLKNRNAVEDQAEAAASYVWSFLTQLANNQPINPQVTHQSVSAYTTRMVQTPMGQTTVMVAQTAANSTPGAPSNNGILQPVYNNVVSRNFVGYCVINGEQLFIANDETIVAPMRGFMPFGRRFKPGLSPQCYFDLQFPAARACAHEVASPDPRTGSPLYGYEVFFGSYHAGRCVGCTPELCP